MKRAFQPTIVQIYVNGPTCGTTEEAERILNRKNMDAHRQLDSTSKLADSVNFIQSASVFFGNGRPR